MVTYFSLGYSLEGDRTASCERTTNGSVVKRLRHRPFTAVTRVRFPSESFWKYADMAQLAEQLICNQQVNGSSPFIGFAL